MNELLGNYGEEIAAVIGALFVIARVVVLITPTKDDDKIFKGTSGKILLVSKTLFGLDPKQGLKKHGPK